MSDRAGERSEPIKVLLVEDALDEAHLIRFLLEEAGPCHVTVAQDGLRGAELAEAGGWGLIISDLNLPGLEGLQVIERSREAHPDTPILATTGYTHPDYLDRAMRSGADDVLPKPLARDDLLEKVGALLGWSRGPAGAPGTGGAEAGEEATGHRTPNVTDEVGEDGPRASQVLVLAARPGEVEAGCTGALLRHREDGDAVTILVLGGGTAEEEREAAKAAARRMGARIFVGNLRMDEPAGDPAATRLIAGAVDEVGPSVAYVHSEADLDPAHRSIREILLEKGGKVEWIYGYSGSRTGPDFSPTLFVPLDGILERKLELAAHYGEKEEPPPHLAPSFLRAQARYWGRYEGYSHVEPLELVQGSHPGDSETEEQ